MDVIKTSIRYFIGKPVRAIWLNDQHEWWYSATDLVTVLAETESPRIYWNAVKRRNPELLMFCRQLKLTAVDGKKYETDTLNEKGIRKLVLIIPSKNRVALQNWLNGLYDPLDEQSKKKAYEIFNSNIIDVEEVGKTISLQKIHAYLFEGLYNFAGKIRTKTISKGGFTFANGEFLPETLKNIDVMPESSLKEIVNKYVEMNIAHPFMEGNGRATRLWLDFILKKNVQRVVDWSKIEKSEYLDAMKMSPIDGLPIFEIIEKALTKDVDNCEIFLKGIDYSYYYEED